jgi:hypothetical protein
VSLTVLLIKVTRFVKKKMLLIMFLTVTEISFPSAVGNSVWSFMFVTFVKSGVSSVSIVSDYGLGDRGSIPGRGKGFFL